LKELLLGIAVVYTILVLSAGVYFHRKTKTLGDYLVAGRALPLPIVFGTIWATYIGGATIVGWTGAFYTFGLDWWFYGIGAIAGVALISTALARSVYSRSGGGEALLMVPPRCRRYGYVFKDLESPRKPSRCPRCRSEWIEPPRFTIGKAG